MQEVYFLATESAIASKWCNWELGYGDAHKYRENIVIMECLSAIPLDNWLKR